jgi:hypothetical protein
MAATLAALQTFFNRGGEAQRPEAAAVGYARMWRRFDQFRLRYDGTSNSTREECLSDFADLMKEMNEKTARNFAERGRGATAIVALDSSEWGDPS